MDGNKKKYNNVILSILFVIIISFFMIFSLIIKDNNFSEIENRNLALAPEFSLENMQDGTFTEDFEKYVQDQFPFRNGFMEIKSESDLILGKKDNGSEYFGKKGWLFAINQIDENHLKKNIKYINDFSKYLPDNVNTDIIVVPTAVSVMKKYLPKNASVPDEDKAMSIIDENIDSNYIDFFNAAECLKGKSDEKIFYKTDHHWTTLGAFYTYQFWNRNKNRNGLNNIISDRDKNDYKITKVSDEFYGTDYSKAILPGIEPDSIERFDLKNDESDYSVKIFEASGEVIKEMDSLYDEEYLSVKDKYSYFLSGNNPLVVIERTNSQKNGKSVLVIKDSFAHCFIPFIAADYDQVVVVDLRYYRKDLTKLIDTYKINDVLFLYNIINLSEDNNIVFINNKK